jgi:hypothetical protein
MDKNPKKILEHVLKIKEKIQKIILHKKVLHRFYIQFVKFQRTLTYILKILKKYF